MIKDYIKTYSDIETAEKWLKKNIEQSNVPPVSFKMGDKHSSECKWIKTVEEKKTAVDFPESDEPAARIFYDIVYTSKELGVEVRLTVTSYPDYPIVEYSAEMKNISGAVSPVVEEFYSVRGGILDADEAILHHTAGGFYGERCFEAKTAVLKEGAEFELCSDNGMASMGYLPFMNAEDTEGEKGVIVAVNSSGDWTAAYKAEEGSIKAACGYRFLRLSMLEGETLYFPGIVLLFYKDCDWQYGQNIWRRWLIKHNMMRYVGNRDFKENVYLGSAFPGTATDLNFIETAIEAGLNEDFNCVVEYDAPWYETYGQDWGNTGDYRPAVQYANGGLNRIANKCHENGMKIAFWMEPERPKYDTAQCKELGDDNVIYLHSPDQPNTTYWFDGIRYIPHSECVETGFDPGFNCLLNYSKKASVDYVADLVDSVVKSYGVDVYRQDFNANNGPFWRVYDE
ncbi:MAG: hypothetical protein E7623_02985, partial [Ruminococcaceae bacterium]|nr:hypothetical protein [Oscillospiraceae bacterium]